MLVETQNFFSTVSLHVFRTIVITKNKTHGVIGRVEVRERVESMSVSECLFINQSSLCQFGDNVVNAR